MGSSFTKHDLQNVTDYIEFEAFCNNLMSLQGYKDLEPYGGHKDKGRDAIHHNTANNEHTVFSYSVREDWMKKLYEDVGKVVKHKHPCNNFVFVSTGVPTSTEKDNLKAEIQKSYGWKLEFYDLERIATLVDAQFPHLIALHPGIFKFTNYQAAHAPTSKGQLDTFVYANAVLQAYEEWLEHYTTLFAGHWQIKTFLVRSGHESTDKGLLAVDSAYEHTPISFILGESGSGKTTALWRMAAKSSKELLDSGEGLIPIFVSLRDWQADNKLKQLVSEQFSSFEVDLSEILTLLEQGKCLILIDGLNEIMSELEVRRRAYDDLVRFMLDYSKCRYVISCRTSDFSPHFLNLDQIKNRLPIYAYYEIRRLDRQQVTLYIRNYFNQKPELAVALLVKLEVDDENRWSDESSLLNLVRIPLYLQLVITKFEADGQLPESRSALSIALIRYTTSREVAVAGTRIDLHGKEALLARFAYDSILRGYGLRIPEQLALSIMRNIVPDLKSHSLIHDGLTIDFIWQELLSSNFLRVVNFSRVEWLHQLIYDYFIAQAIMQIVADDDRAKNVQLNQLLLDHNWSHPSAIALSLLGPVSGSQFLLRLINLDSEIARKAFKGLIDYEIDDIVDNAVLVLTSGDSADPAPILMLTQCLVIPPVVESLFSYFRANDDLWRPVIARSLAEMIVQYHKAVDSDTELSRTIKRAIELTVVMSGNKNTLVRFYAAKGLWGFDPGRSASVLKELTLSGDDDVVAMINDLREEWGIE